MTPAPSSELVLILDFGSQFGQLIARLREQELPHELALCAFKIDCRSPSRGMPIGKEGFGVAMQVIQLGPEMIINHIQIHHDTVFMRGAQKPLEVFGSSILCIRRVQ